LGCPNSFNFLLLKMKRLHDNQVKNSFSACENEKIRTSKAKGISQFQVCCNTKTLVDRKLIFIVSNMTKNLFCLFVCNRGFLQSNLLLPWAAPIEEALPVPYATSFLTPRPVLGPHLGPSLKPQGPHLRHLCGTRRVRTLVLQELRSFVIKVPCQTSTHRRNLATGGHRHFKMHCFPQQRNDLTSRLEY